MDKGPTAEETEVGPAAEHTAEQAEVPSPVLEPGKADGEPVAERQLTASKVANEKVPLSGEEIEERAMNGDDGWEDCAAFAMGEIDECNLSY